VDGWRPLRCAPCRTQNWLEREIGQAPLMFSARLQSNGVALPESLPSGAG